MSHNHHHIIDRINERNHIFVTIFYIHVYIRAHTYVHPYMQSIAHSHRCASQTTLVFISLYMIGWSYEASVIICVYATRKCDGPGEQAHRTTITSHYRDSDTHVHPGNGNGEAGTRWEPLTTQHTLTRELFTLISYPNEDPSLVCTVCKVTRIFLVFPEHHDNISYEYYNNVIQLVAMNLTTYSPWSVALQFKKHTEYNRYRNNYEECFTRVTAWKLLKVSWFIANFLN